MKKLILTLEFIGLFELEPTIHRIKITVSNIRPIFENPSSAEQMVILYC